MTVFFTSLLILGWPNFLNKIPWSAVSEVVKRSVHVIPILGDSSEMFEAMSRL